MEGSSCRAQTVPARKAESSENKIKSFIAITVFLSESQSIIQQNLPAEKRELARKYENGEFYEKKPSCGFFRKRV